MRFSGCPRLDRCSSPRRRRNPLGRAGGRAHTEQVQRRPAERGRLIRPAIKEVDALRMDGRPVRARETQAGRHAGSEVEEALAPDLGVGRHDRGCG